MTNVRSLGVATNAVIVSGWGRTNPAHCQSISPHSAVEAERAMARRSSIARGRGRSYGDAAQNSGGLIVDTALMNKIQPIDATGLVTVGAGVTLDQLLHRSIPAGWFVPVTPGTRQVSVGGAIAADIHGKNHHADGSFCDHITSISVRTGRGDEVLTPNAAPREFWATAGGMGLTGLITEATIQLRPIETSLISTTTARHEDLDSLMAALVAADRTSTYTVAWIDTLNSNAKLGRGIVLAGEHATLPEVQGTKHGSDPLRFAPHSITLPKISVPIITPGIGRAFNEIWYRRSEAGNGIEPLSSFFHPLDAISNWNLLYGRRGFIQWQIVVPDEAASFLHYALRQLARIGAGSFLSVLKRFGPANSGLLSFPKPGWTLAVDLPVSAPTLKRVLDDLDRQLANLGGRVYLAKDARLDPEILAAMYPRLDEWREIRAEMDPRNMFRSDLARRLNLIQSTVKEQTA